MLIDTKATLLVIQQLLSQVSFICIVQNHKSKMNFLLKDKAGGFLQFYFLNISHNELHLSCRAPLLFKSYLKHISELPLCTERCVY